MFVDADGARLPASSTSPRRPSQLGPPLLGDRSHSVILDNSKNKALVPEFVCTTPYTTGVRDILTWFDANPARRRSLGRFDGVQIRSCAMQACGVTQHTGLSSGVRLDLDDERFDHRHHRRRNGTPSG